MATLEKAVESSSFLFELNQSTDADTDRRYNHPS